MKSDSSLVHLWDYGWLWHDRVELPHSDSDDALIQRYIASAAFHTSFLPSDKDEKGIHGPFHADRITKADFIPLSEAGLDQYLASVKLSETQGGDEKERAKVLSHLRDAFKGGSRCYVLKADERSKDLFHDWGFVLWLFREFLFVGAERDGFERFVIGYD